MTISVREPSSASAPGRPHRPTFVTVIIVTLVVCGYLGFVRKYCSPYAGGSDPSGYLNAARLMLQGELVSHVPRIEGLAPPEWNFFYQQPLGFEVDRATGAMTPTYPIGFPLHLAVASFFVGLDYATVAVNFVLVAASAALMIALARYFGLPWLWALAGAALLWACPLYALHALQPMSDLPATVWVMAAIWLSLKSRDRWTWGFAAGFAIGSAVLVRPTNLLVLIPVGLVLGYRARAWAALVVGGLPGAVFLGWLNHSLWGSPFRTGYGTIAELLSFGYVPHNTGHFALWIFLLLSPPVALGSLGLLGLRKQNPLLVRLIAGWSVSFVGFYLFYFHSGEVWWYLRFILPMFPALILAAAAAVFHASKHSRVFAGKRWLAVALLGFALSWDIVLGGQLNIHHNKRQDAAYKLTAEWTKANLPSNAILLQMQLSGAFVYYTDFAMVRWDLLDPATTWPQLQHAARIAGRPLYAVLYYFEEDPALQPHIPGSWELVTRVRHMSVWQLHDESSGASSAAPEKA